VVDAAEGALSYGTLQKRVKAILAEHEAAAETAAPDGPSE